MPDGENALYADSRLVDLYDLLNQGDWDYAFYSEQIGKQRRNVLDLGCGTGTFALRLAAAGHDVIAVDPSATMISYARHRPGSGAVEWMVGEAASVQDRAPFDVVTMTGHAFQCLLTDEEVHATLRTVREILKAGGTFMFETRNPVARPWTTWTPALSARSIQSDKYGPVDVFHDCIAVAEPLVEFETHYVFGRDNTQQISKSRLRFTSRDELASRIKLAGFREIEWFGNWSGGPFQEASSAEIIAICHA
ncbi:class I SAM-dependent methyltransferase [Paraburkholderia sp. BCC1885]|uniref:class I SAM-dependent methyltransferase n=1 Tax=Paraburkholderia sp. BCC1885 TaxID=2562669 RepID=UPI001181D75C|nr:class I SAM-dependent methyltransferase [Paraburkholderia sp. BCC1885]